MVSEVEKIERFILGRWIGMQKAYGYWVQVWIGRLRLHVFLQGDPGEALHSHPWPYTSFPFSSYVEEYLDDAGEIKRQVIRRFRLNRQPATHTHRILGKWSGKYVDGEPTVVPGRVVTICFSGRVEREMQFFRMHKGRLKAYDWKPYLRRFGRLPSKRDGVL